MQIHSPSRVLTVFRLDDPVVRRSKNWRFCRRLPSASIVVGIFLLATVAAAVDPVEIGTRRELFVDYFLIDKLEGTHLKLQRPLPGGTVVKFDQPWEGEMTFYTTVFQDGDIYRMYYRGNHRAGPFETTCYAESPDGIHWTKPELGLVEFNGSKQNNIIMPRGAQFCPFIDQAPGVTPSERYKANSHDRGNPQNLIGFISADAIHWKQLGDKPILPFALRNNFDSQNVIFWSEVENCYVAYARHQADGRRATARATSTDFRNWTEQTPMRYSDTGSTLPSAQLYTNQTQPYFRAPHIYVSLPGRIFFGDVRHISLKEDIAAAGQRLLSAEELKFYKDHVISVAGGPRDRADAVFLTSRAGTTQFDFTFKESFIRPGIGDSHWQTRNNYPVLGVVPTGPTEMSLYVHRDYGQQTAYLERMTLRIDGFSSLNAPYEGGQMITKPFTFEGQRLEINYSTSAAGSLQVEIQDADGQPIPGYALDKCPSIIGDHIERVVAWGDIPPPQFVRDKDNRIRLLLEPWKGTSDVSQLVGKPIRLRFVMKDADLYSFRFQ